MIETEESLEVVERVVLDTSGLSSIKKWRRCGVKGINIGVCGE